MTLLKPLIVAVLLLPAAGGFSPQTAFAKEIRWQSFEEGFARGRSENKKVVVHFYARWCPACKSMQSSTFKDPGVIAMLNRNYVPVRVDIDKNKKISKMFKIKSVPDTWFIAKDYKIIGHHTGYIPPAQLKALLKSLMKENPAQ